jgi:hypothetical protein
MIFGLALLVVALVLWRFLPRERLLMERARRVCSVCNPEVGRRIFVPYPNDGSVQFPCYWLSDHDLISFGVAQSSPGILPSGYNAWHIAARTGAYAHWPQLDRTLQALRNPGIPTWETAYPLSQAATTKPERMRLQVLCRVSPDGKWILWGSGQPNAFAVDGKRPVWFPASISVSNGSAWLPDSRHWIGCKVVQANTMQINICCVDRPGKYDSFDVPNPGMSELLGCTRGNNSLFWQLEWTGPKSVGNINLLEIPLVPKGRIHRITITPPPNHQAILGSIALSPQGDRLAYLFTNPYTPPSWPLMRHLWHLFGIKEHQEQSLWVSDLDGSHMHEIGHVALRPGIPVPRDLRWTPSGTKLSFIAGDSLYTVD